LRNTEAAFDDGGPWASSRKSGEAIEIVGPEALVAMSQRHRLAPSAWPSSRQCMRRRGRFSQRDRPIRQHIERLHDRRRDIANGCRQFAEENVFAAAERATSARRVVSASGDEGTIQCVLANLNMPGVEICANALLSSPGGLPTDTSAKAGLTVRNIDKDVRANAGDPATEGEPRC